MDLKITILIILNHLSKFPLKKALNSECTAFSIIISSTSRWPIKMNALLAVRVNAKSSDNKLKPRYISTQPSILQSTTKWFSKSLGYIACTMTKSPTKNPIRWQKVNILSWPDKPVRQTMQGRVSTCKRNQRGAHKIHKML